MSISSPPGAFVNYFNTASFSGVPGMGSISINAPALDLGSGSPASGGLAVNLNLGETQGAQANAAYNFLANSYNNNLGFVQNSITSGQNLVGGVASNAQSFFSQMSSNNNNLMTMALNNQLYGLNSGGGGGGLFGAIGL